MKFCTDNGDGEYLEYFSMNGDNSCSKANLLSPFEQLDVWKLDLEAAALAGKPNTTTLLPGITLPQKARDSIADSFFAKGTKVCILHERHLMLAVNKLTSHINDLEKSHYAKTEKKFKTGNA